MNNLIGQQRLFKTFNIKSKNTKPEIRLRSALFAKGYRYKIHVSDLPGTPDIVLPKYKFVINVHGCFWHHHGCPLSSIPKTREDYWLEKFEQNKRRDFLNKQKLKKLGWRVFEVWECSLTKRNFDKTIKIVERRLLAA